MLQKNGDLYRCADAFNKPSLIGQVLYWLRTLFSAASASSMTDWTPLASGGLSEERKRARRCILTLYDGGNALIENIEQRAAARGRGVVGPLNHVNTEGSRAVGDAVATGARGYSQESERKAQHLSRWEGGGKCTRVV